MKYIVTLNGKKYEVEVEKGQAEAVYLGPADAVASAAPAAVAAAHDMQLQAASKAVVERDFGAMHLTLNGAAGTESFVYFYFDHPKNTPTETHALRFDFTAAGRVSRAEVILMSDPSLVEPQ